MHAAPASTPAAAEAVTASGNHLTTPSASNERQQQPQQHLTGSTHLNTDSSSQPLGLSRLGSEQLLSSSEAVAVAAADGAGPSSRGAAGLTGWLQIVPVHQQQQGGAVSADCASTMHPDIRSRDEQQGTPGSGSGGSGASGGRGAQQQNQLAHCNSAGGLSDASRHPWEAGGTAPPCSQQPQQHAAPADKQQQHAGNLRRHLLSGWRNKRRGSTDNSSVLDSPTAAAAAAAPAGTAGSHDGHSSERTSGHHSGVSATAAAAAAAVVSSGGTVAIMHAPEANGSNGNRGSGGGSQPSWTGTGGSSARRLEDEEGRKEQAEQQVCVCVCWAGLEWVWFAGAGGVAGCDAAWLQPG